MRGVHDFLPDLHAGEQGGVVRGSREPLVLRKPPFMRTHAFFVKDPACTCALHGNIYFEAPDVCGGIVDKDSFFFSLNSLVFSSRRENREPASIKTCVAARGNRFLM